MKTKEQITDFLKNSWSYIKRGKTEMWFLLSLYNTFLLYTMRYDISVSIFIIVLFGFILSSYFTGYYLIKKVDIVNPKINPFTQDNVQSAFFLNEGLIYLAEGNNDKAKELFIKSRELRRKWINNETIDVT